MQRKARRPAGVDRSVLRVETSEPLALMASAGALGRRAAIKIIDHLGGAGFDLPETRGMMADVIEAECRGVLGAPRLGEVVLRFSYEEAVQAAAIMAEAREADLTGSEADLLLDLRARFLAAIGLGDPVE